MGFLKTVPNAGQMLTPPNARGCHWVMMDDVTCAILREYSNITQNDCKMLDASCFLYEVETNGRRRKETMLDIYNGKDKTMLAMLPHVPTLCEMDISSKDVRVYLGFHVVPDHSPYKEQYLSQFAEREIFCLWVLMCQYEKKYPKAEPITIMVPYKKKD